MRLDKNHQLYKLSNTVDWPYLESELSHFFKDDNVAQHRFMASMVYLKDVAQLSSKDAMRRWEECPYWRYMCGETDFSERAEYPYSPYLLDIWTRSLEGAGYEVLVNALMRLPKDALTEN